MDTTDLVVAILGAALDVEVSTEVPEDRPERFVQVDLAGDQSDAFVLRPRYALTCWGATDKDAHSIAVSCVDALREAAMDDDHLSSVAMESMSRDGWGRTGQARYLVEVDLTINTDE